MNRLLICLKIRTLFVFDKSYRKRACFFSLHNRIVSATLRTIISVLKTKALASFNHRLTRVFTDVFSLSSFLNDLAS